MVRNVFFNVPARRRFLKSNQAELKHLIEQFERIVLVYPGVSFSFYSDGNLTLNLPATTQRRRITDTLGQSVDKGLIPIHFENEISNINGFVSLPDCAKKRGAEQFLFVNGRYMRSLLPSCHPLCVREATLPRLCPQLFSVLFHRSLSY